MALSQVTISFGVIAERVGDELLVIVPGRTDTVRLTDHAADLFLDIQAGRGVDTADLVVANLVDLGVVQTSGMSRRGLIKAGAIGAGAGIAVMAMPSVAAASSESGLSLRLIEWYPSPDFFGSGDFEVIGLTVPDDQFPDVLSSLTVEADDSPGEDGTGGDPYDGGWNTNGASDGTLKFAYFSGLALPPKSATLVFDYNGSEYTVTYQAA
jgi:hypothetical protein